MNKAYRTVYNEQTRTFVAVAENVKSRGKKSSSSRLMRNAMVAVTAGLMVSSATFAAVEIDDVNNSINFAGGAGSITNVGSITGLQDLTIAGELQANKITVTTGGSIASGSNEVVTGGQLFDVQEALDADITANAADIASNKTAIEDNANAIASNTNQISGLDERVTANTNRIDGLDGRMDMAESNIIGLQTEVNENKDAIDDIFTNLGVTPDQAAGAGIKYFRANSELDDAEAEGEDSIAIGPKAKAEGEASFAAGKGAVAENDSSIAIGDGAKTTQTGNVSNDHTIAIGTASESGAQGATAIGHQAQAQGINSLGFGTSAQATGSSAIALGNDAHALAEDNISIGRRAGAGTAANLPGDRKQNIAIGAEAGQNVRGYGNTAIGFQAGNNITGTNPNNNVALGTRAGQGIVGEQNISIGYLSNAGTQGERSIAIGSNSKSATEGVALGYQAVTGEGGLALGRNSNAAVSGIAIGSSARADSGYIAIGSGSVARQVDIENSSYLTNQLATGGALSVGSSVEGSEVKRRITNVADGAEDSDAVTVAQLKHAVNNIDLADPNFADGVIGKLQQQIDENMKHYVSINDAGQDQDNKANNGAQAQNSMAIGPNAKTSSEANYSIAMGHTVASHGKSAITIGHDVIGSGNNSTTIGNSRTEAQGESSIAIGTQVKSYGKNTIVIGRESSDDEQGVGADVSDNSIVIGTESISTAEEGIVLGKNSTVNAKRGIAQGSNAEATATDAIALGTATRASGTNAIAQGTRAGAHASNSQASGTDAQAYSTAGIALGKEATSGFASDDPAVRARNTNSIAIGTNANAIYENTVALGVGANAIERDAIAQGTGAQATARDAMAVGTGAEVTAEAATAQGAGARATHKGSVALGAGSQTIAKNSGDYALTSNYTAAGRKDGNTTVVSVGTQGNERQIVNVAPGVVSKDSTDAINGSQLWATNDYLQNLARDAAEQFGGNTQVNPDGTLTDPNYKFKHDGDKTYQNVADAMQGLQDLGMNFEGDDGGNVHRELGQTLTVKGGASGDLSEGNIGVIKDGEGGLSVQLAKDLTELNTIEVDNSVTIGGDTNNQTVINEGNVTTNNLNVSGETKLGDNFWVTNEGDVHYDGDITEGTHIVNKNYLDSETGKLVDAGLNFVGDDGNSIHKDLGETLSITGGADLNELTEDNIGVVEDADGLKIQLAQNIDLGDDGSVKMGDTFINNEGLTINNGPSITVDGIDAGNKKITNVAPGEDGSDAVNVDQLEELKTTVAGGWTATDKDGNDAKIAPGGVVTFVGDDNITVAQTGEDDDAEVVVSLNKDLNLGADGSVTMGDTSINNEGLTITGGPSITIDGIDAGGSKITNVAAGTDDTDAVNVSQLNKQEQDLTTKGLNFVGDDGTSIHKDLGEELSITGGANLAELTENNIGVVEDADGLKIQLAQNIDLGGDGSVTMGDTSINNEGLTITGGPSITIDGIDAGGSKITNVAAGTDDTDAVNVSQLNKQEQDLTTKGLNFVGDDGTSIHKDLGEELSITGGANLAELTENNIGVVEDADGLKIQLAQNIDLGGDGSVTMGGTTVNSNGLTINNGPSITLGGINAGGKKITNVAPGVIDANSMDAINGSQLQAMGDSLSNFFGEGISFENGEFSWDDYFKGIFGADSNITNLADALEPWNVGAGGDKPATPVLPGDDVDFSGTGQTGGAGGGGIGGGNNDGNIVVDIESDGKDHNLTFDLADNVHINESLTVGDIDSPHVSIGADGDQGSAGSITFYDPDEGVSASQTVVAGPGGVGTDQGANDSTRLQYTDGEGNQHTVASLGDGLSFGANDGDTHHAPLNTQVNIKGHDDNTDWSQFDGGQNIMTQVDGNQITIAMANDIDVNSVTTNSVEINNGPVINSEGIDMRETKITNLAAGTERTDAVNLGQLQDTAGNLQGQINNLRGDMNRIDKRNRAGIAAAMATAGLPQAYLPGKSMIAMGGATWRGETGLAIGVSTISDNGHWVLKLSGTISSRGDFGGTAGVGYQW